MPLSDHLSGKKRSTDKTSKNPLTAWFQKRKKSRKDTRTEAENIIYKLSSINFEASPLPPEVLEEKQYPEQPCGNIEYRILEAIERLQKNTQDYIGLDISKINNGIYQIAVLAKQTIDAGNVRAARAACLALSITIGKIRNQIPSVPAPLQKNFIDCAEKYIDIWIDYILKCTVLDGLEYNAKCREEAINRMQREIEKEKDAMAERLINDPALIQQFRIIQDQRLDIHGDTWNQNMIELYRQMLNIHIKESNLEFEILRCNQELKTIIVYQKELANFLSALGRIPQQQDPNVMDNFRTLINESCQEAIAQEQPFEEIYLEMNLMPIGQLNNENVSLLEKEAVLKQLDEMLEKAKKKQLEIFGITEDQQNGSDVRLYTIEEIEQCLNKRYAREVSKKQIDELIEIAKKKQQEAEHHTQDPAEPPPQNPNDPPPQT